MGHIMPTEENMIDAINGRIAKSNTAWELLNKILSNSDTNIELRINLFHSLVTGILL